MQSTTHDVNVYVIDGVLNLIAYKLIYSDAMDGKVVSVGTSVSDEVARLTISMHTQIDQEISALRYLLDSEEYNEKDLNFWEEYDSWASTPWLAEGDTPDMVKQFSGSLKAYTPELDHNFELPVGSQSLMDDMKCACGAVYEVQISG